MPDPTGDAKSLNYAKRDDRSRRLWDAQIGKANPWEHRGQPLDEEAEATPQPPSEPAVAAAPSGTVIPQQDRLRLQRAKVDVENPFESLIEHQLHLKLPDQAPTV